MKLNKNSPGVGRWLKYHNKGKKMNKNLETEYAQAFKDEVKIKLDEHGNPIVPVPNDEYVPLEKFKTETVKNEG